MEDLFYLCAFVAGICVGFLVAGVSVLAYVYLTQGKQAAIEFFEREF